MNRHTWEKWPFAIQARSISTSWPGVFMTNDVSSFAILVKASSWAGILHFGHFFGGVYPSGLPLISSASTTNAFSCSFWRLEALLSVDIGARRARCESAEEGRGGGQPKTLCDLNFFLSARHFQKRVDQVTPKYLSYTVYTRELIVRHSLV